MRNYFIIFILYELLISSYFYNQYIHKVDLDHKKTISLIQNSCDSVINAFTLVNDEFHSGHADSLAELVVQVNNSTTEHRDIVREKILDSLMGFYTSKNLDIFSGMHVFDKEGASLLRFHKVDDYDDKIIDKRPSLKIMQDKLLFQHGLEIGIHNVSYRYQYPLFYDGTFVGSYEYNVDYNSMLKEIQKFYAKDFIVLFDAKEMEKTVLPEVLNRDFDKNIINKEIFYSSKKSYKNLYDEERLKYLYSQSEFSKALHLQTPTVIDYSYTNSCSSIVFPLKDISQKNIAYVVATIEDTTTGAYLETFIHELLLFSFLSLVIFYYILKEFKHKAYVRNLLDRQKDMLIVTDGAKIKDTNQAFLDFFDFKSLKEFQSEHDCICDFFIEEDGFVQKNNDGVLWIDYLYEHINEKNRVKIRNPKTSEILVFELEFESFSEKNSFLLFRDITKEYKISLELHNRAHYDALTKIHNRASFDYELSKELRKSSRYGNELSLIMFDIDHFKDVNDKYGHDVGDIILKEITSLVNEVIRETDFFARWGGEEFMIICHCDLEQSEVFAQKLRKLIEAYSFTQAESLTSSFGVAQYRKYDTIETLVKRSDEMLYKAKTLGRNRVISS